MQLTPFSSSYPQSMASEEHKEGSKKENVDRFSLIKEDPLYKYVLEGILKAQSLSPSQLNFSSSDTILCSYPKSGTTWLKALAFAILNRSRLDATEPENHPLLSSNPHTLTPFLEFEIAQTNNPRDPKLTPLVSTHIPAKTLPKPVLDSGCKIVYIYRNPKDVLVSYYHYIKKLRPTMTLKLAFILFCGGATSPYGSYWDHVLGFWEMSVDHPERVLFLKYEDMMKEESTHVTRLAEFMGFPFLDHEVKEGVPVKIGEMCSFGSLSNLEVNKKNETNNVVGMGTTNSSYFRKAQVGDWRNYLTEEMSNKLDQITIQKLANSIPLQD